MTHAARALQSHGMLGEGINLWFTYCTYFFYHTRTWRTSPDEGSAQCPGPLRDSTNMEYNTHQRHSSFQQGDSEMMIMAARWYSGTFVGLKFPDICLTGEEKYSKNLTQDTCPDRESNPDPLRDRLACYRLFHSGGQYEILTYKSRNYALRSWLRARDLSRDIKVVITRSITFYIHWYWKVTITIHSVKGKMTVSLITSV